MGRRIIEQRRRGPIGSLVRLISWGIHLYFVFILYTIFSGEYRELMPELANNEPSSVAVIMIIGWVVVALVLAFLNFLFRGRKEFVEEESSERD